MSYLTVRQAAEQVGLSRQTMFRKIKDGKVSATISHTGEKQIEVTELIRAFGPLQGETVKSATSKDNPRLSHRDSPVNTTVTYQIELERLKAQLELRSAELELAKERILELKAREHESANEKNRLLCLVEQQTRLLAAPNQSNIESHAPLARKTSQKQKLVGNKEVTQATRSKKKLPAKHSKAAKYKNKS